MLVFEPMRVTTLPGRAVMVVPPAMIAVGVSKGAGVPVGTGHGKVNLGVGAVAPVSVSVKGDWIIMLRYSPGHGVSCP